jgi:biotin transport system substrate-specific component
MTTFRTNSLAETVLPDRRLARLLGEAGLVVAGSLVIALSAKAKVPLGVVDMSLQTLAIMVIAGLYGFRLGTATILAYLAEGVAGFPVFQGTPEKGIGLAYMVGPTGGYLLGFVAMTMIAGWAADRGWGRRPFRMALAMFLGEVVMLLLGAAWLAWLFGVDKAIAWGVGPFVLTDMVKVALAAALVAALSGSTGWWSRKLGSSV